MAGLLAGAESRESALRSEASTRALDHEAQVSRLRADLAKSRQETFEATQRALGPQAPASTDQAPAELRVARLAQGARELNRQKNEIQDTKKDYYQETDGEEEEGED